MIRDLTESIEALMTQPGLPPELGNALIRFDRPTDPYTPEQTTVNVFLYEIRENLELRSNEPERTVVGSQTLVGPPPLRVTCMYLITAWPVGGNDLPQQEHRLLSQVLQLLAGTPFLPNVFLQGSLIGQNPPIPLLVAHPDSTRNVAEFWAAVGNKLKPSISLTATISMPVLPDEQFPTVITATFTIEETLHRIGGTITDAANAPVVNASVTIVERGRQTRSRADGRYTIPGLPAGNYTLSVTAGMTTQTRIITVPAPLGSNYNLQLP